ncbi:hypothetical protein [Pseudarthrobacter sp. NamE5]|uniref:hypothetical protein n=1 Tax=Pseudarthrobacter sp. NamE5 TaxID=2576839 RepID=UPI00110ACFEF|nr:hypothetical protein [Pseudarthrobacter sp. NamE5]TLM80885.1 hypothetical protein FDW84_18765 [Pseudarthrobacter sp. NamE5]
MSQSTESTTESNPFTKPGFIIAAALVVALIAATVIIFLLPKGQGNAQPAETSGSATVSPSASAAVNKSICGLPASSDVALGSAPSSKWELVGRMAAPTDPNTIGPGVTAENGFRSCFAQSPTGALYAAANMVALGGLSDEGIQRELIEKLVVPGRGRDAALKDIRTPSSADSSSIQIRGFVIKAYSTTAAHVDLAFSTSTGEYGHCVLPLKWIDGDWKVEISDAGELLNDVAQIRDLGGFIPWSGA